MIALVFRTKKKTSLSQIYKGMLLIMIPVLILSAVVSVSLEKTIRKQSIGVLRSNLDLQVQDLSRTFNNINYCLMNNLNDNTSLPIIQEENGVSKNNAVIAIKNDFTDFSYFFGEDYQFFLYDEAYQKIYSNTPKQMDYQQYHKVNTAIELYMKDSGQKSFLSKNRKWNLVEADDNTQILIKVYRKNQICIGCWVLMDTIEQKFGVNNYSGSSYLYLVKDSKVLTNQKSYQEISGGNSVSFYISKSGKRVKDYDIYYYDFNKGSFSILSIIDTLGEFKNNLQVLMAFILLLFIFIGLGIFLLYYIRYRLIIPISSFMDHLYHEDEIDEVQVRYRFDELRQVDELYQKARKQIKELKIAVYEKELQKRKLEQDYFQVQIKPHFYLNCLNIIYNMAQSKRFDEIQKLSMEVSKYLRTLFRSGMDYISIREEINHLKGYLNIQEMRYSGSFTYQLQVDEELLSYKIIPLIAHTIVENSIKHTIMQRKVVHIDIAIMREISEVGENIKIVVWDTGDGFKEEVLTSLRSGQGLVNKDGNGIGLSNMLQRLKFVYQDEAQIVFSNREGGGAQVEVRLPVLHVEEEKL